MIYQFNKMWLQLQAGEVIRAIKDFTGGIGQNETTKDGLFTF